MTRQRRPQAVVEDRIEVHASPEVLWTCFSDLGKWPHWFPALSAAEWAAGNPWTLGARLRQNIRFGFPLGRITTIVTLCEISPAPYVAWEGKVAGMEMIHGYRFDATANGTEVLSRHEFYGSMALLIRPFLNRCVHKTYRAALYGLKVYVETGTIQLKMPV